MRYAIIQVWDREKPTFRYGEINFLDYLKLKLLKDYSILEKIFLNEQNEINFKNSPSMTSGDFIIIGNLIFRCKDIGFERIL
jgi:hypothetical protein